MPAVDSLFLCVCVCVVVGSIGRCSKECKAITVLFGVNLLRVERPFVVVKGIDVALFISIEWLGDGQIERGL